MKYLCSVSSQQECTNLRSNSSPNGTNPLLTESNWNLQDANSRSIDVLVPKCGTEFRRLRSRKSHL